jgi:plastocyanin
MKQSRRWSTGRSLLVGLVAALMVVVMTVAALAITKRVRATPDRRWMPKVADIRRGDRVRWTNPTGRTHDVTAYGGWSFSRVLSPGESAVRTFNTRGVFKYRCVRHSGIVSGKCQGMCGRVKV